jgi:hypothetical protein
VTRIGRDEGRHPLPGSQPQLLFQQLLTAQRGRDRVESFVVRIRDDAMLRGRTTSLLDMEAAHKTLIQGGLGQKILDFSKFKRRVGDYLVKPLHELVFIDRRQRGRRSAREIDAAIKCSMRR